MPSTNQQTQQLLGKYLEGTYTASDLDILRELLKIEIESEEVEEILLEQLRKSTFHPSESEVNWSAMLERILESGSSLQAAPVKNNQRSGKKVVLWRLAAAAVFVFIVGLTYFYIIKKPQYKEVAVENTIQDVPPGSEKAVLTLADGRQIILDTAGKGTLAEQGGIKVTNFEGRLTYAPEGKPTEVVYNKITTPRGGNYQLELVDGTKVWLNAGSSIQFPTAFPGNERMVDVEGEAYFEVAHNTDKPFKTKMPDGSVVQVLGTHFNVNAYNDESGIKVTLIEGAVEVSNQISKIKLRPGQQAILDGNTLESISGVNIQEVTAWKNGYFHFESASLSTILRELARWYDIQVDYQGSIPDERFFVIVNRNSTLSSVLQALQESLKAAQINNIKFKIEGKRLIVQNQ